MPTTDSLRRQLEKLEGRAGGPDPEAAAIWAAVEQDPEWIKANAEHGPMVDGALKRAPDTGIVDLSFEEERGFACLWHTARVVAQRLAAERGVAYSRVDRERHRQGENHGHG